MSERLIYVILDFRYFSPFSRKSLLNPAPFHSLDTQKAPVTCIALQPSTDPPFDALILRNAV